MASRICRHSIVVDVPATTANLGPGFDSLGLALCLHNRVGIELTGSGLVIELSGEGAEEIPADERNLVFRAAMRVFRKLGKVPKGIRIRQSNRIPLARGLGSSAAAIIGGMHAANELMGRPYSISRLIGWANKMEGHPDNITPAMVGGLTASSLVNGEVKWIKLRLPRPLLAVAAVPDFKLSTDCARKVLPDQVPFSDAVFNVSRASLLVAALASGRYNQLTWAMDDCLHQDYRVHLVPGLIDVIEAAKAGGALAAVLSGAGPTVLAFCTQNADQVGQEMANAFKLHQVNCRLIKTEPSVDGARRVPLKHGNT